MIHVGWPQGIYLAIGFLSLGIILAKDGEPQKPYSIGRSLIAWAIVMPLLYWGGFFS